MDIFHIIEDSLVIIYGSFAWHSNCMVHKYINFVNKYGIVIMCDSYVAWSGKSYKSL